MNMYDKIIITSLTHEGTATKTMVIQIPPTIAEHNVVVEVLRRLRLDYPGAWYCVQEWERNLRPAAIGPLAADMVAKVAAVKEVTREHLGLPTEDLIGDVPH